MMQIDGLDYLDILRDHGSWMIPRDRNISTKPLAQNFSPLGFCLGFYAQSLDMLGLS